MTEAVESKVFDVENRNHCSLLFYLESRAVDHGGVLRNENLNGDDWAILEEWSKKDYVKKYRICSRDLSFVGGSVCVELSDDAFRDVHNLREARAKRLWSKRTFLTTEEYRNLPIEDGGE